MLHKTVTLAAMLLVGLIQTSGDEKTPQLQSSMKVKLESGASISAGGGKVPLELIFTNKTDKEQKFSNAEYRMVILNKDGEQIENPLVFTLELRDIVLKGRSTVDKPGVSLTAGKLKAGEEYFLVVSVRNLIGHVKFAPQ